MSTTTRLFLSTLASLALIGCDSNDSPTTGGDTPTTTTDTTQIGTFAGAIKLDANNAPQTCTGPDDPECNAEGPGMRLQCDADLFCRLYLSDDDCLYPELGGTDLVCQVTTCGGDVDCDDGDTATEDTCIFTEASSLEDPGGVCFPAYADCVALEGTPCEETGVTYCSGGDCICTVDGDLTKATSELCDDVDNDCDSGTDEDFNLGDPCDSNDSDLCALGTLTCAADELGTECVNESPTDVAEACNGEDDDCDGDTDEDFPTLGASCDDADADLCSNGEFVCSADGSGVTCAEVGLNVTEVCDGADNDCDGETDEGCDDDEDGFCDETMTVMAGATCTAGDCNDSDDDVHPEAVELCDDVDNDCDGATDEDFDLGSPCFDGEGVCMIEGTLSACSEDGMSAVCSAQADESAALSEEICNGEDDTCNGVVDEGCDDDGDTFCDGDMVPPGEGAVCTGEDCDDTDPAINTDAIEVCDGADNDCDGETDEGCDDDGDTFCDETMTVMAGATCTAGDCNDENGDINPGMEEQCITAEDDNCDGLTDVLANGVTPACDSCANALELACGVEHVINMATEPNAANSVDSYQCWTNVGAKQLKTTFSAPEVVVVPDADPGTQFSLQIMTGGTGTIAARLHGSCDPNAGTSAVTAYNADAGLEDGTCAGYGTVSVAGGVVGEDWIVLDAASAKTVTVKFTCVAP